MLAIPATTGQVIISCNYDGTGKEWVDLFDNPVLGWIVDETAVTSLGGPTPFAQPVPPLGEAPIIVGTMPPGAADTAPILSPQWAHMGHNGRLYVPDMWRGEVEAFFTFLATNNGAQRKVRGNFADPILANTLYDWSKRNPELFNEAPF